MSKWQSAPRLTLTAAPERVIVNACQQRGSAESAAFLPAWCLARPLLFMSWHRGWQVLLEHFIEQAPLPPGAPVYVPPAPAAAGAYRFARSAASAASAGPIASVQQMRRKHPVYLRLGGVASLHACVFGCASTCATGPAA